MNLDEQKIVNAFFGVVTRNKGCDPITLCEKLKDRLMALMEDADTGYGVEPVTFTREQEDEPYAGEPAFSIRTRTAAPKKEETRALPPRQERMIVMPDDPEFKEALQTTEVDRRAVKAEVASSAVRLTKVSNPDAPAGAGDVCYWTYEGMVEALHRKTPKEIIFTPNGMHPSVKVKAERDVKALIGTRTVRLEYASAAVSGDHMSAEGVAVLGLTASKAFALTDQSIDVTGAMDSIETQLKGLYAPRNKTTAPADIGPSPLDGYHGMDDSPMGAGRGERTRLESGWQEVGNRRQDVNVAGKDYSVADASEAVLQNLRNENSKAGGGGGA